MTEKNTNKATLPAVPPGVTWRLVKDVETSRSGDGLYVDLPIATNDFDALVRAGYALFQQAAEAKVAEALKGKTEAAPEVKQAEQRVAATEKELGKLHRELVELQAKHEQLVEGDTKLTGVELATAISQNEAARRDITSKITGAESGLVALKQRAAELRRAANRNVMSVAPGIAEEIRAELREKREQAKARVAAVAGEEYAKLEMLERAYSRATDAFVRDIVARQAGISLADAPPPELPRVAAPAASASPAPAAPASASPAQSGLHSRAPASCQRCSDLGFTYGPNGAPIRCSECSPAKKPKKDIYSPNDARGGVIVG